MREPSKNLIYNVKGLNTEQYDELINYIQKYSDENKKGIDYLSAKEQRLKYKKYHYLRYNECAEVFSYSTKEQIKGSKTTNAKELFYTLENVQVDCSDLSSFKIKHMVDICIAKGYNYWNNSESGSLQLGFAHTYFQITEEREIIVDSEEENKQTITYEKFMELFGSEESNFKKLVDVLNEEITEAYKETDNKLNYELDFNFITQLAERMAQNKHKYDPYNWQKLDNISELKQALYRHVMEVMKGNYADDNRLFGHLESIAINAMFINYQLNKKQ